MAESRQILERIDENAAAVGEVAQGLREQARVRVLDESASSLLVEGAPEDLERAAAGLAGWRLVPLWRIQVPDTRPRVLRPPDE